MQLQVYTVYICIKKEVLLAIWAFIIGAFTYITLLFVLHHWSFLSVYTKEDAIVLTLRVRFLYHVFVCHLASAFCLFQLYFLCQPTNVEGSITKGGPISPPRSAPTTRTSTQWRQSQVLRPWGAKQPPQPPGGRRIQRRTSPTQVCNLPGLSRFFFDWHL